MQHQPQLGENYSFYTSKGKIKTEEWKGDEIDLERLQFNNVWKTPEHATIASIEALKANKETQERIYQVSE